MAWFKDWFDTPYYHLLYGERDEREAQAFINVLIDRLRPAAGSVFLDLACGKGRHSAYLASHGFAVYGVDLSVCNISEARQKYPAGPLFDVHDMRLSYKPGFFDYVLNLFTSFGYFEQVADNNRTLEAVVADLKPGGTFIQDYLNPSAVMRNLTANEVKRAGGIDFHISKELKEKCIIKTIAFSDGGCEYRFQEKVSLFSPADFREMYRQCGLEIIGVYGDYGLNGYNVDLSERQIYISRKI